VQRVTHMENVSKAQADQSLKSCPPLPQLVNECKGDVREVCCSHAVSLLAVAYIYMRRGSDISIADPLKLLPSATTYWHMLLLPINGSPTSFRRLCSIDVHLLLYSSYHPLELPPDGITSAASPVTPTLASDCTGCSTVPILQRGYPQPVDLAP